jgi:hypothetical protein
VKRLGAVLLQRSMEVVYGQYPLNQVFFAATQQIRYVFLKPLVWRNFSLSGLFVGFAGTIGGK